MGFEINPYNKCVANKTIDGAQCTVVWYIDDIKVSHVNKSVVENIMKDLENHFGELDVTYGNNQEYLGMNISIKDRKLVIDMEPQIDKLVSFFDEDITNTVLSPANKNLMNIDKDSPELSTSRKENFHRSTAKLLYIEKQSRPDLD